MTEVPIAVGIGASAGGVEALTALVSHLPEDLGAPILVVLHLSPKATSVLAGILDRRTSLRVTTARHGERPQAGHVYVAPPDRHLRVAGGRIVLDREPRVGRHRPAVDPMLQSLASEYGSGAVGVILSGSRDDGTVGLGAVKAAGGQAFVQDPEEALYPSMPASALAAVDVDGSLGVAVLAARLAILARVPPADRGPGPAVHGHC